MNELEFNPELLYQEAMQAHQSGQFVKAEELLRKILEKMPDQDAIMGTLGGVLLAGGKIEESISTLEKAIDLNPENVDAQLNLGIAFRHVGRAEEGLDLIKKASTKAPDRVDIQYNYANVLMQAQRLEEAAAILEQAIKTNPSFLPAYHAIAAIHQFYQKKEAVVEVYERALEHVPNDLNTTILLGNFTADIGWLEKAKETYLKGVSAHSDHFLPHAVLGKFYLDLGEDKEGETSLLKAYELNPMDFNTVVLLGNVYKTSGRIDAAEEYYRKALKINPEDPGALGNLRRILSQKIPYWHFEMLADTERNDAYQKAIEKVINKESSVLDIGTGSGLLSMMAARAGAKSIVACEMHQRLAETAKKITQTNGFGEVIQVFNKKSTQLKEGEEVPEKVDIIISEILDVGALGEGALPSIRHAVQNLAKPNPILIPSKVNLFGQLIEIPSRSLVAPIRNISGFDLSLFEEYRIPNEYLKINLKAEKYRELSSVFPLMDIDFYNLPPAYADDQPNRTSFDIKVDKPGMVQALVFWFDLYLDDSIKVSSRVNGKLEHWGQALFCFPTPKKVNEGDVVSITMLQSDQIIRFKM